MNRSVLILLSLIVGMTTSSGQLTGDRLSITGPVATLPGHLPLLPMRNGVLHVNINTYGGDAESTRGFLAAIKTLNVTLKCHVDGVAASAGMWIFSRCHERTSTKGSTFMFHDVSLHFNGRMSLPEVEQLLKTGMEIQREMKADIMEALGISEQTWSVHAKAETYFSPTTLNQMKEGFVEIVE